jgi:hypothetical protein
MDSNTKGMVFIIAIIAVTWISLAYIFVYKPQQPQPLQQFEQFKLATT